jgi:hypothetical protein
MAEGISPSTQSLTCVGIRTLDPRKAEQTVASLKASGVNITFIQYVTDKGPLGVVTNKLLDYMKMDSRATQFLIIDDDILLTPWVYASLCRRLGTCDATSVLPIPTEPQLNKYYKCMFSRYEKLDIEPFTFSCALMRHEVVEQVRIDPQIVSREEHAFHKVLVAKGFKYNLTFNEFVGHTGKTPEIDARHNRWYAKGIRQQEGPGVVLECLVTLALSPLEGILYALDMRDFFGFPHTINLRWNQFIGVLDTARY